MTSESIVDLTARVVACLTPDLLLRNFRYDLRPQIVAQPPWPRPADPRAAVAGHCYVASEVLFHLGLAQAGYRPKRVAVPWPSPEGIASHVSHWYLENALGEIVDATAGQFLEPVSYHGGRGCGFLTRRPSLRAQVLINRVRGLDKEIVWPSR